MIKKEKIGILIYGKGANSSVRELLTAAKIVDKGLFRVTLFGESKSKAKAIASQEGLRYVKLGKIAGRQDFKASLKFTQLLKDENISTIIFRDQRTTNLLVTAKFLMKGKLRLIFIQNRHLNDMKPDFLHTFRFNQIDAWITPINQTANAVKASTNLALDKVHVLPLPIPRKPYRFDEDERKLRKSILFGNPDLPVVGWNVPKESDLIRRTLGKLMEVLRSEGEVNVCLNSQKGSWQDLLAEMPELLAYEAAIKVTPFDSHDADMYAHLDVILVDPETEPFSGIIRRALMAGVLPVAPKSLVADELLENGRLGLIYTDSDGSNFIDRVTDSNFLSAFKAESQAYIGEKYTKKRFKENLEALISALPKKAKAR